MMTVKQGDLLPALVATLRYEDGSPAQLEDATEVWFIFRPTDGAADTAQKKPAVVSDAAAGQVSYTWEAGDTDEVGDYNAEFEVHYTDGVIETFPSGTYIEYSVVPQLDGGDYATPLSSFREPIRCLLQDNDPDIPEFADDQLDASIRLSVNSGKVPGYEISNQGVVPPLTPKLDQTNWVRLVYYSAKRFGVSFTDEYLSSRSASFRTAQPTELTDDIMMEIYELENGNKSS